MVTKKNCTRERSVAGWWLIVQKVSNRVTPEVLKTLYFSMEPRIQAMVDTSSRPTKYRKHFSIILDVFCQWIAILSKCRFKYFQDSKLIRSLLYSHKEKRILKNIWLWYLLQLCFQKIARRLVSFMTEATVPSKRSKMQKMLKNAKECKKSIGKKKEKVDRPTIPLTNWSTNRHVFSRVHATL